MEGAGVILVGLVLILIYFIPSMVAGGKRNYTAIFWLNLLLGWTLLGWIGALIWALTQDRPTVAGFTPPTQPQQPTPSFEKLKRLRDEGILTQEEFMEQIRRIQ